MAMQSFKDPNSDEARQHLLDRRCERKHPKRHRTLNRSRKVKAAQKRKQQAKMASAKKERSKFLKLARAYWNGAAEDHP